MRLAVLTALSLVYAEALECGIHVAKNEELKATIRKCVSNNKTLEDLWDMTPTSSESSDSSSSEEVPVENFQTRKLRSPDQVEENTESSQSSNSSETVGENCAIQCIFENLQMIGAEGYPEHGKILESLLKNAPTREFRDFIQDSADECFQETEKDATTDSCTFSSKLVTCLADKGKANCADWPIGNLPFTTTN